MIDINSLRRLEQAATPGPWRCEQDWTWELYGSSNTLIGKLINAARPFGCHDDARLIPAMRNALPELLTLLEEARELISQQFIWSDGYDDKARAFLAKFTHDLD